MVVGLQSQGTVQWYRAGHIFLLLILIFNIPMGILGLIHPCRMFNENADGSNVTIISEMRESKKSV